MRKARRISSGGQYHVVARANRREFILGSDAMKQLFMETIERAKRKFSFTVTNICIMDNHFHLMITPGPNESLSRIMQWILSVFAIRFNKLLGVQGHVWYDRFKSRIISSLRQFIATFDYITANPVRAKMVYRSENYRYSGHRLLLDGPPGVVDNPGLLVQLLFPGFGCTRTNPLLTD